MFPNVTRTSVIGVLLCLCLSVLGVSAIAQDSQASQTRITNTKVDTNASRIIIEGENFGSQPPSVSLAGTAVNLLSSSDSEIITELPGWIAPGMHVLEVSRDSDTTETGKAKTTIVIPEQ